MADNVNWDYEGIGQILAGGGLQVPKHQREYSWEKEHVEELCRDLSGALQNDGDDYFLGTVVLTSTKPGVFQVVDGQQRLATTIMILAAIRDMLLKRSETKLSNSVQENYLSTYDIDSEEYAAKLILNISDNGYFEQNVLTKSSERQASNKPITASNKRIQEAFKLVRSHLESYVKPYGEADQKALLKNWINFLKHKARVIKLTVADSAAAYTMFETLNDRGVKVSKADLVKNYLFSISGDKKLPEAVSMWTSMMTCLGTVEEDENVIDFLRIYCSLAYGLTREKEVFKVVKSHIRNSTTAVQFLGHLDEFGRDYVAMLNPNNPKWNEYPRDTLTALQTLSDHSGSQVRGLMLAVAHYFKPKEAAKAYNLFVSWMVRLFIAGHGRVGRVEEDYASMAHSIHKGELSKASQLAERMIGKLAKDAEFETAFSISAVSKEPLARYYLHTLERFYRTKKGIADLVPHGEVFQVNLEHILPKNPDKNWPNVTDEVANDYYNRIGNLALLNAKTNSKLGNASFKDKVKGISGSEIALTKAIGVNPSWGEAEINARQQELAKLAVKTWPLTV